MEKEFVSYEQAVALYELGFNDECLVIDGLTKPLKQQVFRWFREKYGLNSHIHQESRNDYSYSCGYGFSRKIEGYRDFTTYEEAENACIDKLIELTKTK